MNILQWRVYRVIAVTDQHNRDSLNHLSNPGFVPSLSAPSYCTPGIIFWLAESGIEVPGTMCVLLEFTIVNPDDHDREWADTNTFTVEFEWADGRYIGVFEEKDSPRKLKWANGQNRDATICSISSL